MVVSAFASRTTATIDLPGLKDDGTPHQATVQKLSGRQLEAASVAYLESLSKQVGVMQALEAAFAGRELPESAPLAADPLQGYDRYVVIQRGTKSWTLDAPVSAETIDDLDAAYVQALALGIMRLTLPDRFDGSAAKNA